jgi:hypothetical protein
VSTHGIVGVKGIQLFGIQFGWLATNPVIKGLGPVLIHHKRRVIPLFPYILRSIVKGPGMTIEGPQKMLELGPLLQGREHKNGLLLQGREHKVLVAQKRHRRVGQGRGRWPKFNDRAPVLALAAQKRSRRVGRVRRGRWPRFNDHVRVA